MSKVYEINLSFLPIYNLFNIKSYISLLIVMSSFYPRVAFGEISTKILPNSTDNFFQISQNVAQTDEWLLSSEDNLSEVTSGDNLCEPRPQISPTNLTTDTILIKGIEIKGSTIFSNEQLQELLKAFIGQSVTIDALNNITKCLTNFYINQGYITSSAIVAQSQIKDGIIPIKIIEGYLKQITIEGAPRLADYARSRIELGNNKPLNVNQLEDQLELLRRDPLIEEIDANLQAGQALGESILKVIIKPSHPIIANISIDNYSPPVLGSERFSIELGYRNLTGTGDQLLTYFKHTSDRSQQWNISYNIPFNPMNGTINLRTFISRSEITSSQSFSVIEQGEIREENFNLTLSSDYDFYEGSIRQPIIRTPRQELAFSFGFSYRDGFPLEALEATVLHELLVEFLGEFGLQSGLEELGLLKRELAQDKTSVFQLGVDYISRDPQGVWSLRSQVKFGTGLFDATVRPDPFPDGQFTSGVFQAQRLQSLGTHNLLIIEGNLQLTGDNLLSSEQFVIGGGQSVRGFRQNVRFGDNGYRFSIEDRIFLQMDAENNPILQLAPFLDIGEIWNNGNSNGSRGQKFLAGLGTGFIWSPLSGLTMRLDFTIPLVDLDDRGDNIQDDGIYFNIIYQP